MSHTSTLHEQCPAAPKINPRVFDLIVQQSLQPATKHEFVRAQFHGDLGAPYPIMIHIDFVVSGVSTSI